MVKEKGSISINTENIFPIIKKFLYSDNEIFLREMVSNSVDACQKMKRLSSLGHYKGELGELKIQVALNADAKTITISDNGNGMTAEEIKKYINQVAFSGATEFIEMFKEGKHANEIIGRFGLGFYSAFMASEKVEIETLSYIEGAEPAHWVCDGSTSFEINEGHRRERGTDVILHINDDSAEFLDKNRLQAILDKYAKFLPVPIQFGTRTESIPDGEDKDGKPVYKSVEVDNIINNTTPIWTKPPASLKDEDYLSFYRELYPFSEDPLFWIHLNVDYPFNLTGVLYFPKLKNDFEIQKNKIQLYSRQVFITDEVKDVVPDFLMLLHGILDSPDIPLNVSRSYLQSDANVKKISKHTTKKVDDKLVDMFIKYRKEFEKKWDDISVFVRYGMISDEKFYEKAKEFSLLKNVDGQYFTLKEYEDKVKINQIDKDKNVIYLYTTDAGKHHSFIESPKAKAYDVLLLDGVIDSHFIGNLEQKLEKTQLKRVDSEIIDKLIAKDEKIDSVLSKDDEEKVKTVFQNAINNKSMTLAIESLSPNDLPVTVTMSEWMRRMKDMARTGGGGGMGFMG